MTKIVSRMPQIVFRAPEGRPLAPGDRPGRSQPPSRGALGSYPGPSGSFVLLKENIDFPLSAPHRRQAPLRAARGCSSAPGGRPRNSQPPLPGARWEHPGPSKTYAFLKENITFPLSAPHRRQAPQSTSRWTHWNPLSTPAPRGTNCFYPSILNFSYT